MLYEQNFHGETYFYVNILIELGIPLQMIKCYLDFY